MSTRDLYQQAQPQWPFTQKSLPNGNLTSPPPLAPYPDTFEAPEVIIANPMPPSVGPFLRFTYAIYGFNHAIYYN